MVSPPCTRNVTPTTVSTSIKAKAQARDRGGTCMCPPPLTCSAHVTQSAGGEQDVPGSIQWHTCSRTGCISWTGMTQGGMRSSRSISKQGISLSSVAWTSAYMLGSAPVLCLQSSPNVLRRLGTGSTPGDKAGRQGMGAHCDQSQQTRENRRMWRAASRPRRCAPVLFFLVW